MSDILVVEDGATERERLRKLFTDAGYKVDVAEDSKTAERILSLKNIRLLLLDVGLSDRSGSHLFSKIRHTYRAPITVILTGNPSVHLKRRFLEEGAAAYILKASFESENEQLLKKVETLLGNADFPSRLGIKLEDFLSSQLREDSRKLFLDLENKISNCQNCGYNDFIVTFDHKTQLPPCVEGLVICSKCGAKMDPEVG